MAPAWTDQDLKSLESFLSANEKVDWRAASLSDAGFLQGLRWTGANQDLLPVLKAYQRLLFILPEGEERRALPLLGRGFQSALQVASTPRVELAAAWEALFPGEAELGEQVRQAAVARRSQLALHHLDSLQSNEPHYRAARFR